MSTPFVAADEKGLARAREILLSGGVAVIPTDTVYGLAAHPAFLDAAARLFSIKARAAEKPIALLAASTDAAAQFLGGLPSVAQTLAAKHWPGALTLVLPTAKDASVFEGVRVPNHDWTRRLLSACGGVLRVTSANLSGQRAATDAPAALADVGLSADLVVDGGVSPGGVASTVLRVAGADVRVLRKGPIPYVTLASGSPRRAKILREQGVDFLVVKSDAAEVCYPNDPERTVRENALAKGAAFADRKGVLSADTIVWLENRIYGKPRDLAEAKAFLRQLSGRTHVVFTGVAYDGHVEVVRSDVTFRVLSERAIDDYVAAVKPLDRAGAYDIDEQGKSNLVDHWAGSYENIMGLPLEPLKAWGILA